MGKRGRPPKAPGQKLDDKTKLSLRPRDKLLWKEAQADDNFTSFSEWVRWVVNAHLEIKRMRGWRPSSEYDAALLKSRENKS